MVNFRYFYIQHTSYIVTNEIELYDVSGNNVALNKTATSSSVLSSYVPSKAVDGINTSGNLFHTQGTNNEWIEIDLGQEFDIRNVRIYNEYGSGSNPSTQHVISGALLIGCNDKTGRTDATKRLWSTTFASISVGSNITSPRYWDYSVPADVTKINPTITFSNINKTFGQASFDLSPSSNSSGSFSYTSSDTSVATVSGSTVTIVGAGSVTITATQAETTDYLQGTASSTLTVSQATPTITFNNIVKTFGDASFNLIDPSSNSTGAFSYTSSDATVATVSGSTVTIVGAGSATINAVQASTTNYLQGTVTATLTVNQAAPTITSFSNIVKTFGDASFNLIDPSSNSDGLFSYTSSDTSVATITESTLIVNTPTFSNYITNPFGTLPLGGISGISLSSDETKVVICEFYNKKIYYATYNNTWSSFNSIINAEGLGSYTDCRLTSDGLRGVVIARDGYCYFFTWNGSGYSSFTQTLDTNARTYNGVDITADGSRIVASASGTAYFASWNGTNYTVFTATNETTNAVQGIGITRDGSRISYSNTSNGIYWASWNGTTYSEITQITNDVSGYYGIKVRFSSDNNTIFHSSYGSSSASVEYSTWNGTSYSSFITVPNTAIPGSIAPWGLNVGISGAIHVTDMGQSSNAVSNVYKTNITNVVNNGVKIVTIVGAGSATITATQGSTTNYLQGTVTATLTVNQAAPTIVFNDIIKTVGAQPFNLAPISNSDGEFSYTSSDTSVASIYTILSIVETPTFSNYITDSFGTLPTTDEITGATLSSDGTKRILSVFYSKKIWYAKYDGTSWSSYNSITSANNLGEYIDLCLSADGLRGVTIARGGYCYFFTWNGSDYSSFTQTLDTNARNYNGVDMTSDGSRIVAVANGIAYFATWNGSNYDPFVATTETSNAIHGIGIKADGSKIAYSNGGNKVYWASWNGTNYSGITEIPGASYNASGRKVRFSPDVDIVYYSFYGNSNASLQYSVWNGTTYPSFTNVPTSAVPTNLDPWGLNIGLLGSIYVSSGNLIYKTNITNFITNSNKLSILNAGTSIITATQSATTNYLSGTATSTLTVNKIVTLLTGVTNIVKSFGDIFTLNYVSNSNGSLSYSISDASIATIFGSEVTATKVGSTTITVTQAETDNYLSETLSFVLTVNKAEPLPSSFNNITKTFGDASFNIVAPTSLSSAGFTYISSNISVAVVSGSTITIVGAGSTTIIATQATNDEYLSGSISCVLTVNKASPSLNNFLSVVKTYGDAPFNIIAPTSLSTGSLTYSSSNTSIATVSENIVTIVSTGTVAIIATQEETNNYLSETIYYTLTINKIDTSLSHFENIIKTYGDSDFSLEEPLSDRPGTYVYTSSDESVATISGSTVTIHSGGFITITAIQEETEIYKPGFITCSLKVNRINSTLNYIDVLQVGATYKLKVETNSDGLFSYNVSDSTAVTINSDNTLSFLKPCDVVIIATQAETATYYSGKFSTVVSYLGA